MTNVYAPKAKQGGTCSFDELVRKLEPRTGFGSINGYDARTAQAQGTVETFWRFVSEIKSSGCAQVLQYSIWTYTGSKQTARQYELKDPTATTPVAVKLDVLFSRKGGKVYDAHIRVGEETGQLRARTAQVDERLLRNVGMRLFTLEQPN